MKSARVKVFYPKFMRINDTEYTLRCILAAACWLCCGRCAYGIPFPLDILRPFLVVSTPFPEAFESRTAFYVPVDSSQVFTRVMRSAQARRRELMRGRRRWGYMMAALASSSCFLSPCLVQTCLGLLAGSAFMPSCTQGPSSRGGRCREQQPRSLRCWREVE
jgi:hypothetical protein